jgi:hypothetical protein
MDLAQILQTDVQNAWRGLVPQLELRLDLVTPMLTRLAQDALNETDVVLRSGVIIRAAIAIGGVLGGAAGTAIGAPFGGPIGLAIGAQVGSVIGGELGSLLGGAFTNSIEAAVRAAQ